MADYVFVADPAAQLEARGLSEEQSAARPAGIYTTAGVPNRNAAFDVTIVLQESSIAGRDCAGTAYAEKLDKYASARAEWERNSSNILLQPMAWSHEGRCHPNTGLVIVYLSNLVACRHGVST